MACRCSSLSSVALLAFFLGGGGLESKNLRNKNLSLGNTSKKLEVGLDFIIIVLRNREYIYIIRANTAVSQLSLLAVVDFD